jgi:exonuclease SbcC
MLKLSAFGSYAGTQTIAFAELKGRTFFLIHGPTGAGKTTILDAICFALYGDASGENRDSKSLRSDHADAATGTEVTFDFAVGRDMYRVQRIPEQERLKRRGEGTTVQAAEATLWKLSGEGTTTFLIAGWGKVTEKIEGILGFKSGQFRQVVLLPQGEFRKLLLADSKDRQEIMQTLFKTDLYRTVEEMLKANAQGLKQQFEELTKESGWLLHEANMQSLPELRAMYEQCRIELQETIQKVAQQEKLRGQAQEALTKGTIDQEKLKEQQAAREELFQLREKTNAISALRAELMQASRAAVLAEAEKARIRLELDVQVIINQQKDYAEKLILAQTELRDAQVALAAEKKREEEQEELARNILQLKSMAERVVSLKEARDKLQAYDQELSIALQLKRETADRHAKLRQNIEADEAERQKLLPLSLAQDVLSYQYEQAQETMHRRRQLEEWRSQFQKLAGQHDLLAIRVKEQQDEYCAISATHSDLQKRWLEGQAAFLAGELIENEPCPVCGSRVHPHKAEGLGTIPTEKQVKAQRALMDKQEQVYKRLTEELGKCKIERDLAAHKLMELERQIGDAAKYSEEELAQMLVVCQQKLNSARTAQERVNILEQTLSQARAQAETLAKQMEECETRHRAAQSASKAAEAIMADRQALIPVQYRDSEKLNLTRQAAEEQLSNLKQRLTEAKQRADAAATRLSAGEEAYRQTAAACATGQERLAKEENLFRERMLEAGFLTLEDYERAKKSDDYVQGLSERVRAFDNALTSAEERSRRADTEAENIQPADVAAQQRALAECNEQYNLMLKDQIVRENNVKRQEAWLEKLTRLQAALEKIESDYRVVGRLADVANGRNDYGLTFQRFVLGALLDDVATAANERLKLMSRGRYYLQRTMDRARKNAAGGLDLEIFDNYTGNTRGVNTLSGGETFLASLALALGLADVVQTYTGGIHLDTIFIDEGFGTLDPEALDVALKALLDLQRGGRLVGIISHVPELRERIDARLEIKATDKGSSAQFYVG